MLLTKVAHQSVKMFRLDTARIKIHQISHFIFGTKNPVFFKDTSPFSFMTDNSSEIF